MRSIRQGFGVAAAAVIMVSVACSSSSGPPGESVDNAESALTEGGISKPDASAPDTSIPIPGCEGGKCPMCGGTGLAVYNCSTWVPYLQAKTVNLFQMEGGPGPDNTSIIAQEEACIQKPMDFDWQSATTTIAADAVTACVEVYEFGPYGTALLAGMISIQTYQAVTSLSQAQTKTCNDCNNIGTNIYNVCNQRGIAMLKTCQALESPSILPAACLPDGGADPFNCTARANAYQTACSKLAITAGNITKQCGSCLTTGSICPGGAVDGGAGVAAGPCCGYGPTKDGWGADIRPHAECSGMKSLYYNCQSMP